MARSSKINWRKKDAETIANLARRFNTKITRVSKNSIIGSVQPERINSKLLQEELKQMDRANFNKVVKRMSRYLEKGAEMPYTTKSGVNTTVWQKKEIDNAFRSINAQRRREIKKYNPSEYTGTISTIEKANLAPRKNTVESIKPKNWEKFVENVERQMLGESDEEKQNKYKTNFLNAVEATIGKNSRLYNALENVPASRLYRYYFTEPLLQISFTSDPKDADEIEQIMLDRLMELEE